MVFFLVINLYSTFILIYASYTQSGKNERCLSSKDGKQNVRAHYFKFLLSSKISYFLPFRFLFCHLIFSMNGSAAFECFSQIMGKKKILILLLSFSVLTHVESFPPICGLVKEAIPNQSKEPYFSSHQALNICQVLFVKVIG